MRKSLYCSLLFVALLAFGWRSGAQSAESASRDIILSTTTSTQDSGLLDVLIPLFEKQTGYSVKTVSVGTGQALALAAKGDADVALVHAPSLEKQYVADGKLLDERARNLRASRRYQYRVIRRVIAPSDSSVEPFDRRVVTTKLANVALRHARKLADSLDGKHSPGHCRQHSRLIA